VEDYVMDLSAFDVGTIVAIAGLAVTAIKLFMNQRRSRKEIELSKQYVQTLSKLVESHIRAQGSQQELEKQKFDWQKLKDIAKGLWEIAKSEEE
jgi:type II secretory pathway pseudopilin PulG